MHRFLDFDYGQGGDRRLRDMVREGADLEAVVEGERPIHVATRRRRLAAVEILLEHGAEVDALTVHGQTAYRHAVRRGFDEIARVLEAAGARTELEPADALAVAVANGHLDEARKLMAEHPGIARTGNPERDRLLADVAGRPDIRPIVLLIDAGADLTAPGLDGGTPLHQAAWFGQLENARVLIEAGAPLDRFDPVHHSCPLGWVVHGSRYSGGADEAQAAYIAMARLFLESGALREVTRGFDRGAYTKRLLGDATPGVAVVLRQHLEEP